MHQSLHIRNCPRPESCLAVVQFLFLFWPVYDVNNVSVYVVEMLLLQMY